MAGKQAEVNEDPSFTGPRPSPSIPSGGSFSIFNKVRIRAPADAVYRALIDISRWEDWNSFVPDVTVDQPAAAQKDTSLLEEGMQITLNCRMNNDSKVTKSQELVVQVGPLKTHASKTAGSGEATRAGEGTTTTTTTTPPTGDDPSENPRTVVRWVARGYMSYAVKAEHVNLIDDMGDGTTTYSHWETFGGPLALAVRAVVGSSLQQHFTDWAERLKAHVEKQQSAESETG